MNELFDLIVIFIYLFFVFCGYNYKGLSSFYNFFRVQISLRFKQHNGICGVL